MKKPRQSDLTFNTVIAAVVAALTCDSAREFMLWFLGLTVAYSLIDGMLGKWE